MTNSKGNKRILDQIQLEIAINKFFMDEGVVSWVRLKEGQTTTHRVRKVSYKLAKLIIKNSKDGKYSL